MRVGVTATVPNVDMHWLDETHRRIGAICNKATWLEYQLEMAIRELTDADDMTATQGHFWSELVRDVKRILAAGACQHPEVEVQLRNLLSRISQTMKLRDCVVHSTWIRTNYTKVGHVTGQRWWRAREERRDWSMAELDKIRDDLEGFADELSSLSWNAVKPKDEWL